MDKDLLDYSQEKSEKDKNVKLVLWHPEKARMALAYWVLSGIFLMFLITIACDWAAKANYLSAPISGEMLSICRTGLLPIVTLILGYYFSQSQK